MRNWHYWKKAGPASAPSNIIVVDAETWHGKKALVPSGAFGPRAGEHHQFRLGVALAYRLERGRRTRERLLHFTDTAQFWELAKSRLDDRRPLWIFAHNAGYDVPALHGWRIILSDDFVCDQCITSQSMFLIRGHWHGKPCIFSDLSNYYHCKLSMVGKAVGVPKQKMPEQEQSDSAWANYCENDVLVTAKGLDALIAFVRTNELGPWGVSIASLAFNAFRHRFMGHKILVAADRDVSLRERNAYYGGIVDTQYIGEVPFRPVHELDVNSMYGWACLQRLPYRLIPTRGCPSVRSLINMDPDQMCIAEVTIDHDTLRFPVRTKRGTVYPTGRYRTTIPSPELNIALQHGAVKSVHGCSFYRSGNIFARYMEYFGDKKCEYERHCDCGEGFCGEGPLCGRCNQPQEPNTAFRTISKYYITNLYGKTGQRRSAWERWGEESLQRAERRCGLKHRDLAYTYDTPPELQRFESYPWIDKYGHLHDIRNWFGYIEISGEQCESWNSIPAIAATVTSYARCKLRAYQDIAGKEEWCYSDTDSIWVSDVGLSRLKIAGAVSSGAIGGLEYEKEYAWMRIYGPKDYATPDCVKVKGVKPLHQDYAQEGDTLIRFTDQDSEFYLIRTKDGRYRQTQFTKPLTQLKKQQLDGVFVGHYEKELHREITACRTTSTGWTVPLTFPSDHPDRS